MIHIRDECERVKTGFNFFPLKSINIGFVFRFKHYFWVLRYNKKSKCLWVNDSCFNFIKGKRND